jgi:hypothetical protein
MSKTLKLITAAMVVGVLSGCDSQSTTTSGKAPQQEETVASTPIETTETTLTVSEEETERADSNEIGNEAGTEDAVPEEISGSVEAVEEEILSQTDVPVHAPEETVTPETVEEEVPAHTEEGDAVEESEEQTGLTTDEEVSRPPVKEWIGDTDNSTDETEDNSASEEDSQGDEGNTDDSSVNVTRNNTVKSGWYMRTVVTATTPDGKIYRHDSAGVFGELDSSADKKDSHDIESYGAGTLQVKFVNLKVDFEKEYFSDYRDYTPEDEKRVWAFFVKNETGEDLSQADFMIDVEAMRDVLKRSGESHYIEKVAQSSEDKRNSLILVDIDNQEIYKYKDAVTHQFNMEGKKTRSFRWILNGSVTDKDKKKIHKIDKETTRQSSTVATPTDSSKFGLPPM